MGAIASQITSLTIVYSIVYSDADQRKHQSSASLAFVFPAQMASYAENGSIWWRHNDRTIFIIVQCGFTIWPPNIREAEDSVVPFASLNYDLW